MGQFGDQPDFGTSAITLGAQGDADYNTGGFLISPPCALYIGIGGNLLVTVVGGDSNSNYTAGATLFENIPSGTFMPVMVSYIWEEANGSTVTTCSNIIGLY